MATVPVEFLPNGLLDGAAPIPVEPGSYASVDFLHEISVERNGDLFRWHPFPSGMIFHHTPTGGAPLSLREHARACLFAAYAIGSSRRAVPDGTAFVADARGSERVLEQLSVPEQRSCAVPDGRRSGEASCYHGRVEESRPG